MWSNFGGSPALGGVMGSAPRTFLGKNSVFPEGKLAEQGNNKKG